MLTVYKRGALLAHLAEMVDGAVWTLCSRLVSRNADEWVILWDADDDHICAPCKRAQAAQREERTDASD